MATTLNARLAASTAVQDMATTLNARLAAMAPTRSAIQSVMRQLARGDGIFALYRQALDAFETLPRLDAFVADPTVFRRSAFTGIEACPKSVDMVGAAPSTTETTSTAQKAVPVLLAWERRYNAELLLLAAMLTIIIALLAWLDPRPAPVPSQLDPANGSQLHSCRSDFPRQPVDGHPRFSHERPERR
jgi:hypothetical protein